MGDPFRHLHMLAELACMFLAVFSRMEYALKATPPYALDDGNNRISAGWDRFANDIDEAFSTLDDKSLKAAVDYILAHPPRKQKLQDGIIVFADQTIDDNQRKAQQVLLMVRVVRNNLFHGGKHLPNGEVEAGRNESLVRHSLIILEQCSKLHDEVRVRYEH